MLKGLNIPGAEEKLIINLFTDDTLLYLSKEDHFDDVETILAAWCEALGAKFNIEKTEIIPIGTEPHRLKVVSTRKVHQMDITTLDECIHIAKDGEAV